MELGKKQLDIVILILFFLVVSISVWIFKLNALTTTFLYLVIPSAYLLFRYPKFRKRTLVFALPTGIFLSIVIHYVGEANSVWSNNTQLPRIFTYLPLDSFIWYPAWVIAITAIYQIFLDFKHRDQKISKNYKWLIIILFGFFSAFIVWLLIGSPRIEYGYARLFALPIIFPVVYILIRKPILIPRLFKFSLALLVFVLVYEIVALRLQHWTFPGEYSSLIYFFGVGVPIEELILWVVLGGASLAAYFETFMDDLK